MQSFLWVELKSFQFLHVWFQWKIYCGGMSPTCWISWSESGRNESDRWHVPGTAQSWRTDRCRWRNLESCMKCWYLFESPPICYACESSLYTHVYTMFGVLCCLSWWVFAMYTVYVHMHIYIYIFSVCHTVTYWMVYWSSALQRCLYVFLHDIWWKRILLHTS